jgi:methylenetetrahydrofolate reductase (NADPH)
MNKGKVPGVLIRDDLLNTTEAEAKHSDKGKEASLLRAAGMIATLKEMGYSGVHIGGNNLSFADISFLLDQAESFTTAKDHTIPTINYPIADSWYLYEQCNAKPEKKPLSITYFINETVHKQFFEPTGFLFPLAKKISFYARQKTTFRRLYTLIEHLSKKILFRCRMCGDCTLADSSYLCPQSGCPKKMINGPCGGSNNGYCEVYPNEKRCFWVRSYQRGTNPSCTNINIIGPLPPKDWSLNGSSSWLNYFSGKDHNKLQQ